MRTAFASGVLAAAAGIVLSGCRSESTEAAAPKPVMSVELASPMQEAWPDSVVASGEISAWQEAVIGTELGGVRLEDVQVDVGDVVRKGQLLARYSEDMLRADLARLDAGVGEAQAQLAKAHADASRAERLQDAGAISGQMIESYRTQAQVAEAQLASARARREAQALSLRHARIVAPDDGTISSRSATVGAVSVPGAELFRLVRQNRLEWRAEVPSDALTRLAPGMQATVSALNGPQVNGRLRQLAPTVDVATRNALAYVDLPSGSGLAPGMYVSGRFVLPERAALSVPESAIVQRDGNQYLMAVDEANRVHPVKVTTNRRRGESIEVVGGATPGLRFVKFGGAFLGEGDLVQASSASAGGKAP